MKTKSESNGSQDRSSESWRSVEKGKVIEFKKSSTTAAAKFRIGPYIRLSPSGEDRLEGSLVSHPQRIKQFIDLKNAQQGGGWGEIVEWYEDKDLSGKDMNRAAFQRLLNDISTGKINAVVVTELSRLNRKVKDFLEVWEFFKEHKVAFFSLKESFDTSTAMGEVMLIQAMSFAQYERHTIVDRIKKGARARAERGLANGYVPLGFQTVEHRPNHRQINEPERVYVEMIFRKFLELKRIAKLVEWLNKDSYKTKEFITKSGKKAGGHKWTISSLHSILTNRAYIGEREINKKNRTNVSGTLSEEDKYFFVNAHWPALIPKELFYDVQQMLEANKKRRASTRTLIVSPALFNAGNAANRWSANPVQDEMESISITAINANSQRVMRIIASAVRSKTSWPSSWRKPSSPDSRTMRPIKNWLRNWRSQRVRPPERAAIIRNR